MFKQTIIQRTGLVRNMELMINGVQPELDSACFELICSIYARGIDEISGHPQVVSHFFHFDNCSVDHYPCIGRKNTEEALVILRRSRNTR